MSHIVTIHTEIHDPQALRAACVRLGLAEPTSGTVTLFSGKATGLMVALPGWEYPVVVDVQRGQLRYDNFGSRWGEQSQLDQLLQAYAVEKARLEARKEGHTVTEQALADGSIRLTVEVGGAA